MKKFLGISLLALGAALALQQEASAWCNVRFGIGANLVWQSGNNSLAWGLVRSGQVPGYASDPTHGGLGGQGYGGYYGGGYGGYDGGGYSGYTGGGYGGYTGGGYGGAAAYGATGQDFYGPSQEKQAPTQQPPAGPKTERGEDPTHVGYYPGYSTQPAAYQMTPYYYPNYGYNYAPQSYYYGR